MLQLLVRTKLDSVFDDTITMDKIYDLSMTKLGALFKNVASLRFDSLAVLIIFFHHFTPRRPPSTRTALHQDLRWRPSSTVFERPPASRSKMIEDDRRCACLPHRPAPTFLQPPRRSSDERSGSFSRPMPQSGMQRPSSQKKFPQQSSSSSHSKKIPFWGGPGSIHPAWQTGSSSSSSSKLKPP